MKLFIKNKYITIGGSSYVKDENDKDMFAIKGKVFSITHKKEVYDTNGNLHYIVRNKFWHFINDSTYIYDKDKNKIAMLANNKFDFKHKFVLTGYKDDITISGNLLQFPDIKMEITKNGQKIGTLTKDFNILRDTYTLEIDNEQDAPFMVALAIGVDNIFDTAKEDK